MLPPQRFPSTQRSSIDPDDAIRLTDDDAASSPALGYLSDPFLPLLYKQPYNPANPVASSSRKPPLINVGTHHRTYGIDVLVDKYLDGCKAAGKAAQILSLGAGTDSRFWRLATRPDPPNIAHYVEVDFAAATGTKAQRVARSPKLHSALSPPRDPVLGEKPYRIEGGGTSLRSEHYSLLPLDLRTPDALTVLDDLLDPSLPTLILAECVLCYMQPQEADRIFTWAGRFADRAIIVYEMVGLNDTFGQVMRRNLATRNLKLPGAVYDTPADMAARFNRHELGGGRYDRSSAKTLWEIRKNAVPEKELQRIAQFEHLDEIEELQLVLSHYCIAYASSGTILSNVIL